MRIKGYAFRTSDKYILSVEIEAKGKLCMEAYENSEGRWEVFVMDRINTVVKLISSLAEEEKAFLLDSVRAISDIIFETGADRFDFSFEKEVRHVQGDKSSSLLERD